MSIIRDILDIRFAQKYIKPYIERIKRDIGIWRRDDVVKRYYDVAKQNNMVDNIRFAWLGEGGSKLRTSGIYSFYTKLYSLFGTNDATQTTELNQPNLRGNIAPNEKWAMSNENGQSKYVTHPTISFAANEAWSVSTVLRWNGNVNTYISFIKTKNADFGIHIKEVTNTLCIREYTSGVFKYFTSGSSEILIGKSAILTFIANGAGSLSLYINGTLYQSIAAETTADFSGFIQGYVSTGFEFCGKLYAHIIRSGAMTQSQVTAEYNFFRSYLPPIETVKIGTQDWATSNLDMVATPQGNVIANVTENANVEKVVNGGFDSDTGWIKGEGWTISEGTAISNGTHSSNSSLYKDISPIPINRWMKIVVNASSITGQVRVYYGSLGVISYGITTGNNVFYIKQIDTNFTITIISFIGATAAVNSVSIQEIGWAGSTELYNGIYAATSGTVEQKTYAAVKAASMWRYPSNDALGVVSGKRYNKYASVLLSMDIGYFNTANPTALWGYKVPTRAQLTTLSAIGGNAAKKEGTGYWTTANGTNSSGLTALGGGYIAANGTTTNISSSEWFWCYDAAFVREIKNADNTFDEVAITTEGAAIRLIKD